MRKLPANCLQDETYCERTEDNKCICIHPESPAQFDIIKNPNRLPGDCPLRKEGVMQQGRESQPKQELDD